MSIGKEREREKNSPHIPYKFFGKQKKMPNYRELPGIITGVRKVDMAGRKLTLNKNLDNSALKLFKQKNLGKIFDLLFKFLHNILHGNAWNQELTISPFLGIK